MLRNLPMLQKRTPSAVTIPLVTPARRTRTWWPWRSVPDAARGGTAASSTATSTGIGTSCFAGTSNWRLGLYVWNVNNSIVSSMSRLIVLHSGLDTNRKNDRKKTKSTITSTNNTHSPFQTNSRWRSRPNSNRARWTEEEWNKGKKKMMKPK
mgnify:CR=1 FL=1